jgi:hypothetical protein
MVEQPAGINYRWSFVPTLIILSTVAWLTFYFYQMVIGDLAIKLDW